MARLETSQKKTSSHKRRLQKPDQQDQQEVARIVALESGEVVFYNQQFQELSELNNEVIGLNITNILDFNDKKKTAFNRIKNGQHVIALKKSKKELSLQFNWIDTPQNKRYLVISAEEAVLPEQFIQAITQKIDTKQKTDPESISDAFVTLSEEIHITLNKNLDISGTTPNFTKILRSSPDNTANQKFLDLIYFQDQNDIKQQLQQINQKSPIIIEARFVTVQKDIIWMKWKLKSEQNTIFAVGHDISKEKEQAALIARHQQELSEAEAIARMGQWRWDVGGNNITLSPEIYHIFGITDESFDPTLDNINDMIHHHDSGRMAQVFQRAIIEQNDYDVDFRIKRPDGDIRYIRCEGRCEIDLAEDDVIALYGIMQDVTEATQREIDLVQAKNNAERAYAAKTQFLANMSHELRTPLNAIIGFSEMMQRQLLGPIGTEKYLEYIGGIRESGEHLLDLISDILDMSKIEAGKYELSLEKFNIIKLIRMAVHMMEGRALDSNIKIHVEVQNEEQQIVADRRAIMQMILNLLSNAIKFSNNDSQVTISLLSRENYLSLKIQDEGIGIPANKISSITQPFEQVESHYTKEYEGSGLGLAITKELAEKHGGTLHIESTIDVGTTVTIRLPYDASAV